MAGYVTLTNATIKRKYAAILSIYRNLKARLKCIHKGYSDLTSIDAISNAISQGILMWMATEKLLLGIVKLIFI